MNTIQIQYMYKKYEPLKINKGNSNTTKEHEVFSFYRSFNTDRMNKSMKLS